MKIPKKGVLLLIVSLIFIPAAFAAFEFPNNPLDFYNQFYGWIDFLLWLGFFTGVARVFAEKQFGEDKQSTKVLYVFLGLILATALTTWEMISGYGLHNLGPFVMILALAILGIWAYRQFYGSKDKEGKGNRFKFSELLIIIALILFGIWLLFPNIFSYLPWINPVFLIMALAAIGLFFLLFSGVDYLYKNPDKFWGSAKGALGLAKKPFTALNDWRKRRKDEKEKKKSEKEQKEKAGAGKPGEEKPEDKKEPKKEYVDVDVCDITGQLKGKYCKKTTRKRFESGSEPAEKCKFCEKEKLGAKIIVRDETGNEKWFGRYTQGTKLIVYCQITSKVLKPENIRITWLIKDKATESSSPYPGKGTGYNAGDSQTTEIDTNAFPKLGPNEIKTLIIEVYVTNPGDGKLLASDSLTVSILSSASPITDPSITVKDEKGNSPKEDDLNNATIVSDSSDEFEAVLNKDAGLIDGLIFQWSIAKYDENSKTTSEFKIAAETNRQSGIFGKKDYGKIYYREIYAAIKRENYGEGYFILRCNLLDASGPVKSDKTKSEVFDYILIKTESPAPPPEAEPSFELVESISGNPNRDTENPVELKGNSELIAVINNLPANANLSAEWYAREIGKEKQIVIRETEDTNISWQELANGIEQQGRDGAVDGRSYIIFCMIKNPKEKDENKKWIKNTTGQNYDIIAVKFQGNPRPEEKRITDLEIKLLIDGNKITKKVTPLTKNSTISAITMPQLNPEDMKNTVLYWYYTKLDEEGNGGDYIPLIQIKSPKTLELSGAALYNKIRETGNYSIACILDYKDESVSVQGRDAVIVSIQGAEKEPEGNKEAALTLTGDGQERKKFGNRLFVKSDSEIIANIDPPITDKNDFVIVWAARKVEDDRGVKLGKAKVFWQTNSKTAIQLKASDLSSLEQETSYELICEVQYDLNGKQIVIGDLMFIYNP